MATTEPIPLWRPHERFATVALGLGLLLYAIALMELWQGLRLRDAALSSSGFAPAGPDPGGTPST